MNLSLNYNVYSVFQTFLFTVMFAQLTTSRIQMFVSTNVCWTANTFKIYDQLTNDRLHYDT
jgi:hypothetical protein